MAARLLNLIPLKSHYAASVQVSWKNNVTEAPMQPFAQQQSSENLEVLGNVRWASLLGRGWTMPGGGSDFGLSKQENTDTSRPHWRHVVEGRQTTLGFPGARCSQRPSCTGHWRGHMHQSVLEAPGHLQRRSGAPQAPQANIKVVKCCHFPRSLFLALCPL